MTDCPPPSALSRGCWTVGLVVAIGTGLAPAHGQEAGTLVSPPASAAGKTAVNGKRAAENALRAADDGFGTKIGRESVGIYKASKVRGFSPVDAGNVRIDGLYFDQVWPLGSHLLEATNIRVGVSALGLPFPSPTGIVDNRLRKPGNDSAFSVLAAGDLWGTYSLEGDASLPLVRDRLSLAAGATLNRFHDYNGTRTDSSELSTTLRWTPVEAVEIITFWSREQQNSQSGILYLPAGDFLPPPIERRRFLGPEWANFNGTLGNYGALVTIAPGPGWTVRAGLFRSSITTEREFSNLLQDITPDGRANQLVIADPPSKSASTSGELRISRAIAEGPRRHQIHLSLRGRAGDRSFDGSDYIDLGPTTVDSLATTPRPVFHFSEQQHDRVRQWTMGLAYEGRWRDVGEIGIGVSRANYRKRIGLPGLSPVSTDARPWLVNVNAAVNLMSSLVAYAGYVTGLEESGVAPANATNRNEALPAIRTSQRDAGVRWAVSPKLAVIAGIFDVRKPYYNLAADGRFALLGDVVNRGVEASVAGAITPRLNIVAGAVLLRPRVTGDAVTEGRVGARPVASIARRLQGNVDWRPKFLEGISLDMKASYQSEQIATRSNLVAIPPRTIVDVGGRYSFKLADRDATLRIVVTNIFDVQGFELRGAGAYDIIPRRLGSAYLTVDF